MFPLIEPRLYVIVEVSPVGLEVEHAVGTPLADPDGDLAPASHRIQRHRRPLDREQVKEFGDFHDLVDRALNPAAHPENATPDSRESRPRNTAESVPWEGIPFLKGAYRRRNSSSSRPWRAISTKPSQPDTTPQRTGIRIS